MTLVNVQNLTCTQGAKTLFEGISFSVGPDEKIALIGVNGCGKSTLLTVLFEGIRRARPEVSVKQGLRSAYLPQLPEFNPGDTILDHLFQTDTPVGKVIHDYQLVLEQMKESGSDDLTARLTDLTQQM
ncbi:ABC transporter ATP-binding protein, partial [bacterium]|nr:ABC transporter ATP-binding protein [bacterium]